MIGNVKVVDIYRDSEADLHLKCFVIAAESTLGRQGAYSPFPMHVWRTTAPIDDSETRHIYRYLGHAVDHTLFVPS